MMNSKILRLALPSIASNITVPLLGLCDVTIMGHIGGATSIAAIAIGSMIFNVMYWLFGFLRMGTSGITAQAVGCEEVRSESMVVGGEDGGVRGKKVVVGGEDGGVRGKKVVVGGEDGGVRGHNLPSNLPPLTSHPSPPKSHPSPPSILKSSLKAALCIGLAIVVLQVPLQWLSFWLMQVPTDVYGLCTHYYYICVWGAPAMLGLYSLTGWFIGMQDTRTPMTIAIGQNVLNILLSLFLVIVLHLGLVGVAIGTLVSQWAAFTAAFVLSKLVVRGEGEGVRGGILGVRGEGEGVRGYNSPSDLPPLTSHPSPPKSHPSPPKSHPSPPKSHPSLPIRIYLDIFLRTLCLVSVNLYFTSAGAAQGALTLAANTLLMQFFLFFSYVMDGFAFAGEALAGKSYGACDGSALRRVVVLLFRWGVGMAASFTLAYWLFGPFVLSLLTSDAQVIATATIYLPWAVAIPFAGMAAFIWDGVFVGITATRAMLWSCLAATVAFFTLYHLLNATMANHALWLSMLAYLALRGLLQTLLYRWR